jgi:hypothetical protein
VLDHPKGRSIIHEPKSFSKVREETRREEKEGKRGGVGEERKETRKGECNSYGM